MMAISEIRPDRRLPRPVHPCTTAWPIADFRIGGRQLRHPIDPGYCSLVSVSYTHLDVYKRQVEYMWTKPGAEGNHRKVAYVMSAGSLEVAAGVYDDKMAVPK